MSDPSSDFDNLTLLHESANLKTFHSSILLTQNTLGLVFDRLFTPSLDVLDVIFSSDSILVIKKAFWSL